MMLHSFSDFYNWHHGNLSPLLIIWLTLGLIGLVVSAFNLRDAVDETDALVNIDGNISPARKQELLLVAKAGIRNEMLRVIKMSAIVTSGLVALFSSPTISDKVREQLHIPYWTPTGVCIAAMLLIIIGITVLQSYFDLNLRRELYGRRTRDYEGGRRRLGRWRW